MWNQIIAVTGLNLRSVPKRAGSSMVAVLGIAGVVVVFVGVLSMAQGFRRAMETGGDPLTAIVLRAGANSQTASMLGLETVRLVKDGPGVARRENQSWASAEFVVVVRHSQGGTGKPMNVSLRGVQPAAFNVREEIRMVEGRRFQTGQHEVIVGRAALRHFGDLAVGRSVAWAGQTWNVVGVFQADGGSIESEVWCDVDMLQQAFSRPNTFQAVYAKLESPQSLDVRQTGKRVLRRAVSSADKPHHNSRGVHRGSHGRRSGLCRCQHDVRIGGDPHERDCHSARFGIRDDGRRVLGVGGSCYPGIRRRRDRRADRMGAPRWICGFHVELPVDEPDCVCLCGDASAARRRHGVRHCDGTVGCNVARMARGQAPDRGGTS
jgi:MacB-like periplasmic core domain